jgi:hypothetical protein
LFLLEGPRGIDGDGADLLSPKERRRRRRKRGREGKERVPVLCIGGGSRKRV